MILDEGNRPYPRYPQCDMFVARKAVNGWHLGTAFFRQGNERKWCCLVEEDAQVGTETAITAYGTPLASVTSCKYLGRFLSVSDDNWPAVVRNLRRARQKWV